MLYGSSIFSFLRNLRTVVHSGCNSLHPHQSVHWVPFSLHRLRQMLLVFFLMIVILAVVRWCLIMVLNFPVNQWSWAPFHVSVGHLHFFFGKMSTQFCAHFLTRLFAFLCRVVSPVYTCWILIPFQSSLANIFPIQ